MNASELKQWLTAHNKDYKFFVTKFGVSGSLVFSWLNESRAIPKWMTYALKGLELEIKEGK